jgi:hypothetical protein
LSPKHRLSSVVIPELVEEDADASEALGPCAVEPPLPLAPLGQKSSVLEHTEMMRDCGPGDRELSGYLSCCTLFVANEDQDSAPVRVFEGVQYRVHEREIQITHEHRAGLQS